MSPDRPNILLIVVDCARADKWLAPDRRTVTPVVDRLRATGVTLPVTIVEKACTTPSFASLLTGCYSPRHGVHNVWGDRLPESIPMLTETLARHGYHACAEVSGPLLPEMGLARGFEQYHYRAPCDYLHTAWGDDFVARLRGGHYRAPWLVMLHLWELHPQRQIQPEFDHERFGADAYERAISSLDTQLGRVLDAAGDALIIFTGDHGEKSAAEEYRPGTAVAYARELLRIDAAEGMVPFQVAGWAGPSVLQQLYGTAAPLLRDLNLRTARTQLKFDRWTRLRDRLRLLWLTPFLRLRDLIALASPRKMTAMLQRSGLLDASRSQRKVSRLARRLGQDRLLDMHLRMWINSYKHNLREGHMLHVYDFLVRVPLILRRPGYLPAGAVHERLVRQVDILPTVLDLLGIDVPTGAEIDGRSFRPLLDGRSWNPQPAFVSVSGLPRDLELRGVRTEAHKYTYGPYNPELPEELYDLRRDPRETDNIAAADADVCRELRTLADAFVAAAPATAAPVPVSAADQARVEQHLRDLGYIE